MVLKMQAYQLWWASDRNGMRMIWSSHMQKPHSIYMQCITQLRMTQPFKAEVSEIWEDFLHTCYVTC